LYQRDRVSPISGSEALLEELLQRAAAVSTDGVRLEYGRSQERPKEGAWINGEADQRVGQLLLWDTGELDIQVMRRADETLILNEHRIVNETADLASALASFLWALAYIDHREAG